MAGNLHRFLRLFSSLYDEPRRQTRSSCRDNCGLTWTAARLKCPFPEAAQTFGYVTLQCRYERFPGGSSSGSVTLACPEVPRSPPTNLTFAHCGPPLHTNYDRPAVIVEFVEYYRLMGVTKFYEYDFDTSKNTKAVLNYYKKEGIMEVTNWNLPDVVGRGIHYFGQIALLYDCLLKSSLTHDYTVFSDFDEQFATAKVPGTFESIMNSGRIDCSYVRSALMYPKPRRVDRIEGGNPLLRSAKRIFRETEIFKSGARSKYICRGRLIDVPLIHYVRKFKFKDDVRLDEADPENTLLLHFRSLPHELVNITAETRTLVHVASLKRNVFQIWKNIFGSA
ncbi:hypothetical protein BV898_13044 [Hypsibius exemplaris]|uniref:Glycosyltransferase family 92 protein n=1 Tax=Hypsibius exemplaris TaxID=2072580 RepID=A0A1W0WBY6_HYPEX|nr:hypothetical protein BV898_13044 [Hypsibius exemplaris]